MMDLLTCLIVDDEPLAVEGMRFYLEQIDGVTVVGHCYSALEARKKIKETSVDLIFLDINMPGISGLELLECLENPPMAILTTAYSEYALEGYRLDIVDYLLKPIALPRLLRAIEKAQGKKCQIGPPEQTINELYIKHEDCYVRVEPKEILFVEAMQNYVRIHTTKGTYVSHQTLSAISERLGNKSFYQIHKSFLVNTACIDSVKGNRVVVYGQELPLSKHRKEDFFKKIVNI
ncbi:LytR/AlgR family response regulator transcription factor [Sphingobacterium tabacisoli]|uniref:LytR/AlgR family response regulator transcription factor n=1 Tax=Sphingobacterium tabacisoli TaxID=2044855 RepID=A0ABW5L962_9SPHI|nr:LytTR family DNA-binding domain-containing protein [Sphingobacterium tabacisoli]